MTDLETIITEGLEPVGILEPIYILSLLLVTAGFILLVMLIERKVPSYHRYTVLTLTVIGAIGGMYTNMELNQLHTYNQNLLMSNIYQAEDELDEYTQQVIDTHSTSDTMVEQATHELTVLENTLSKEYTISLKDTERAWLKNNIIPRLEEYEKMKE